MPLPLTPMTTLLHPNLSKVRRIQTPIQYLPTTSSVFWQVIASRVLLVFFLKKKNELVKAGERAQSNASVRPRSSERP